MSYTCIISAVFVSILKLVEAKICYRNDGSEQPFTCGMYEYCCGTRCCRSPIITFYQMWYFWLMVFLTMLFCSGGGWWYRLRNHDAYITPSMAQRMTQTRPIIYPAHGPTIITTSMPMPSAPRTMPYPGPPPPPYYGPPPSYDAVVNLNQNLNQQTQNLNQQNQNLNQQNQNLNQQNQNLNQQNLQNQNLNQQNQHRLSPVQN